MDHRLCLRKNAGRALTRCGDRGEISSATGVRDDCGVDPRHRGGELRRQRPVLGDARHLPCAGHRPTRVDQVAMPKGVGGCCLEDRHGELSVAQGLHLEQQLAKEPAGELTAVRLDLDGGQVAHRIDQCEAGRAPLERRGRELTRFAPAAQEEQRIGGIPAQEVAIHGFEAAVARLDDPPEGDIDRLFSTAEQVQHGCEVCRGAEDGLEIADCLRAPSSIR